MTLTGAIIERQQDQETGEWQYVIAGHTLVDVSIIVVTKLVLTETWVIMTIYRNE